MRDCWRTLICVLFACSCPGCPLSHSARHCESGLCESDSASEAGDSPSHDALPESETSTVDVADASDAADAEDVPDVFIADATDATDATDAGPDVFDAADVADVTDVLDVFDVQDVIDASDARDATDAPADIGIVQRYDTIVIRYLNSDIRTGVISDFYVRTTFPPGFLDGSTSGWVHGHCLGGIVTVTGMPNVVQCTLDTTYSFVNGELIEFYPIKASDSNPVCICSAPVDCPTAYASDFTVIIDPSVATYGLGSGLSSACIPAAVGGSATVMSFTIP